MNTIFFAGFTNCANQEETGPTRETITLLCEKYGVEALFPSDMWDIQCEVGEPLNDPASMVRAIFRNTIVKLASADAVVVNLNIFGGICTNDSAFLVGFASARQKKIIGYVNTELASNPILQSKKAAEGSTLHAQAKGTNQTVNRLIADAISINIQGDIEDCIQYLFEDHDYRGPLTVNDL